MNRPRHSTDPLEARLRADAQALATPPAHLRSTILGSIRAAAAEAPASAGGPRRAWPRLLTGAGLAAAAAAALVLALPTLRPEAPAPASAPVVRTPLTDGLRGLVQLEGAPLLALAGEPLEAETRGLVDDATRTAREFVDALPAPLRRTLVSSQ